MNYELSGVDPLPTIDLKLTLKMVLLANYPMALRRLNTIIYRSKRLLGHLAYVTAILHAVGVLVNPQLGEMLIFPTIVTVVSFFWGILAMRFHMIRVVMKTYEFWYITIISIVYGVIGTIQIENGRWVAIFSTTWSSVLFIMIDANFKSGFEIVALGLLYATLQLFAIVLIMFQAIDRFSSFVIVANNEWVLMSDDVLINILGTLLVMALRSSYRRYQHYQMATDGKNLVRCITYRARVQFVPSTKIPTTAKESNTRQIFVEPALSNRVSAFIPMDHRQSKRTQLKLVPMMDSYDPNDILISRFISIQSYPTQLRKISQCVLIMGVTTSLFSLVCLELGTTTITSVWPMTLTSVSFILTTLTYCITHVHRHGGIVQKLITSFDFLFLNFQVISATIMLIFLFRGDVRSMIVISSLFWILWIMTLDTLTPVIKTKFGITPHLVMYIMIIVTISQFYLVLRVGSNVHDRIIFHFVLKNGRVVQWRAIGFFFTRMFTVCAWCLRLLYRVKGLLNPEHSNALIMVYGPVEYEDVAWMRTRNIVRSGFTNPRSHRVTSQRRSRELISPSTTAIHPL